MRLALARNSSLRFVKNYWGFKFDFPTIRKPGWPRYAGLINYTIGRRRIKRPPLLEILSLFLNSLTNLVGLRFQNKFQISFTRHKSVSYGKMFQQALQGWRHCQLAEIGFFVRQNR